MINTVNEFSRILQNVCKLQSTGNWWQSWSLFHCCWSLN